MAARFLVGGGNGNWTSTTNWSATDGGSSGASAPVSTDDVTFNANSGATNITLDTSIRSCQSLTVTSGYTGTMTFTFGLNIGTGGVSLGANMNFSGTGALILNATQTATSNGKTLGVPLQLNLGAFTFTLADAWTVSSLILAQTSAATTVNGNSISVTGSITMPALTTGNVAGTTNLVMTGTGGLSMNASATTGTLRSNLEINTAGTVTLSGTFNYQGGILKKTAGTFTTTGATLVLAAAATITANAALTIDTLSIIGGNATFNGSTGITFNTFKQETVGGTHTFQSTNTYSVGTLIVTATQASHCAFVASTGSSAALLNLTGTSAIAHVNATDINSSGGLPIYVYSGTLLRTTNWTTGSVIASGSGGMSRSRTV